MWKCTRCGEVGDDSFDEHVCKGKRNLEQLPLDLLRDLCNKIITEDEAWRLADERTTGGAL